MTKEGIYSQIEKFNINIANSKETKNNKYYYINSDEALLKSQFINEIQKDIVIKNKLDSIETVMDLCFGSGNLASHILLENQIQYKNIILNDYFLDECNQELENLLENCELKQCDFFNSDCFEENSVDLLIFNPTHGGKPTIKDFVNKENKDFDALNKTLSKILKPNSLVIFRGLKEDFQELIFSKFKYKKIYLEGSQSLYVCYDIEAEKKDCYEYTNNQFIENENCEIEKSSDEEDLDIGELMQELEENKIENSFNGVLQSESSIVTNAQNDNEEKFTEWWLSSSYHSVDGKPYAESTKKGYLRALKQLKTELITFGFDNIDIFKLQDLKEVNELLDRLESGDLYDYNKRHDNSDTSNGLKQYIKFLKGESNINTFNNSKEEEDNMKDTEIIKIKFSDEGKGNLDFSYKNILFKGVPGTGKSRAINEIIKNHLELAKNDKNALRINIHSASSNSDLMQGIGISTSDKGNIKYSEKQGLILDIIKRATFHPNQPFVLILEEIQENSLNELIGDLIYLIEDDKRAKLTADNKEYDNYEDLVDKLVDEDDTLDYVEIPYLVNDSTKYKKMIMPYNLYIFCTSNYRDDKKVIEDNLLRRFEVIEIYPKETIVNDYAKDFFDKLNKSINAVMEKQGEIHPDRFLIGHAIWKDVENKELFYKAFSKLITEFKDIREIEFDVFKSIIEGISLPEDVSIEIENSYYKMIKDIQSKIHYDFLS
ncbi:ATPase [Sulfurimonas denitrificans DSM 1251]|uniref:ATPase n=1 Tax=Sulfurimonas denitrificans (strain ATCC 33889 / DSM 1251) TaxID=326298 RepID=Q30Q57_SULDN|nr:AAA family ATPase [Sulfurimonas denitrificans]ABB43979.1 ATPase [Sulfurimonas denitrificans DSM 1251]ABB44874.1 ATPase [Sulfurimonas denitrificans DSM 1251]